MEALYEVLSIHTYYLRITKHIQLKFETKALK